MHNFTVHEIDQRTDEWKALRCGRVTGSNAHKMLAKIKSGEAADRRNYRVQLILERLTGKPQESGFVSQAMKDGIEREPLAIAAYEAHTGTLLEQTGFLAHKTLMIGASLDGHLGDFDTLISIKCRQPSAHYEYLRHGVIPNAALQQIRHELFLTRAREHHYVSWQPDFPEAQQLKVSVLKAGDLDLPEYERDLLAFLREIDTELSSLDGWKAVAEGVA